MTRTADHDGHRATGPLADLPPELADLDDASRALFRAFGNAMRLHRRFMKRRLGESDLHPGQGLCLHVLARHDGMSQRDLAGAMHVAPPTLSRMLSSMESAGLIQRHHDEMDQRVTCVYLSDAGRALAREARAALADHIPVAMAALTPEERVELARLLDKLSASIARSLEVQGAAPERAARETGRAPSADRTTT